MKSDILFKIDSLLKNTKQTNITECLVVYLLIEIRKFIDQENVKDKYKMLYFYSNWVAHSELNRKNTQDILIEINKEVISYKSLAESENLLKLLPNFQFSKELVEFLEFFNLPINFFVKNKKEFILRLVDVLIDCPLKANDDSSSEIQSFSFIKGNDNLSINYKIIMKNRKSKSGKLFN